MNVAHLLSPNLSLESSNLLHPATDATINTSQQAVGISGDATPTDSVSLSDTSTSVSAAQQTRLRQIKGAIENGTYSVPASIVAEAMLKKRLL